MYMIFVAFVFNAKSFAIAIILFLLLYSNFWTDWQKLFSNFCHTAALSACDQDQNYQNDMSCAFKPCPLEINGNGRFQREHLESSSSATKNTISPLPQCRIGRTVTYHDRLQSIKSHDPLIKWSWEDM